MLHARETGNGVYFGWEKGDTICIHSMTDGGYRRSSIGVFLWEDGKPRLVQVLENGAQAESTSFR